ncbi:MAG: hypothetical protein IJ461_05390 [Clostridia bacterium]|nr:hypothetical protein [Clostridia bacterium]
MKTPITRQRLRHHFTYCGWMYVVLVVASIFGWDLIYTMTAPRIPPEKQVSFYVAAPGASDQALSAFMQEAWEQVLPDMEDVSYVTLLGSSDVDYTGVMQLSTYIAVGQGDVYMLKREDFRQNAAMGAMLPLEALIESGQLRVPEAVNLNKGYVTLTDPNGNAGERHLFAIPCQELSGFKEKLGINPEDMYLSVMSYSGNQANALKFVQYVLDVMQ